MIGIDAGSLSAHVIDNVASGDWAFVEFEAEAVRKGSAWRVSRFAHSPAPTNFRISNRLVFV